MKKFTFLIIFVVLVFTIFATMAVAPSDQPTQWRVYNLKPDTASYWDINKVKSSEGNLGEFPLQQFISTTSGSFAVYLLTNYNNDITDKTFNAELAWTPGIYKTRANSGAYVRLEFQDVTAGPYDSNDYWWSTDNLDLIAGSGDTLEAALPNRTLWTNQNGLSASNTTTINWTDWAGNFIAESPSDGFTKAMKNVKQLGLSFGNANSYASGVALDGGTGTFQLIDFTIN